MWMTVSRVSRSVSVEENVDCREKWKIWMSIGMAIVKKNRTVVDVVVSAQVSTVVMMTMKGGG